MTTDSLPAVPLSFVDMLLDAVFIVNVSGRIVHVNAACERIFGYSPAELMGQSLMDYVVPEDRQRTREEAALVMAGNPRIGFENRYIRKDGRHVDIMWSARWSETDQLRIGVARDITELKRAKEVQAAIYAVSEAAHKASDLDLLFQEINGIIGRLVPLAGLAVASFKPRTGLLGISYKKDFPDLPASVLAPFLNRDCMAVLRSGQTQSLPGSALFETFAGDATLRAAEYLVIPLVTPKEAIGVLILKSRHATGYSDKDRELLHFVSAQVAAAIERKLLLDELMYSARYDELTGLPNRRLLLDRLKVTLARSRRRKKTMAVLFIDVDRFKEVNDSLGHATGDAVLKEIALRLKGCLRGGDTVARFGGDEFVVLLEDVDAAADVMSVAEKVRCAVNKPVAFDTFSVSMAASIGVAVYPEHGREAEQLLKHADQGMYQDKKAKTSGKHPVCIPD